MCVETATVCSGCATVETTARSPQRRAPTTEGFARPASAAIQSPRSYSPMKRDEITNVHDLGGVVTGREGVSPLLIGRSTPALIVRNDSAHCSPTNFKATSVSIPRRYVGGTHRARALSDTSRTDLVGCLRLASVIQWVDGACVTRSRRLSRKPAKVEMHRQSVAGSGVGALESAPSLTAPPEPFNVWLVDSARSLVTIVARADRRLDSWRHGRATSRYGERAAAARVRTFASTRHPRRCAP
jgi:hypothetical protein